MIRSVLRPVIATVGTVALAVVLTACGGDDDGGDSEVNQALVDAMVAEGATEEQARCFIEELGDDAERLIGADESEVSQEDQEKALAAFEECGGEMPAQ